MRPTDEEILARVRALVEACAESDVHNDYDAGACHLAERVLERLDEK